MSISASCKLAAPFLAAALLMTLGVPQPGFCQEASAAKETAAPTSRVDDPTAGIKVFRVGRQNTGKFNALLNSQFKTFFVGDDSLAVIGSPAQLDRACKIIDTLLGSLSASASSGQESILVQLIGGTFDGESGKIPEMLGDVLRELKRVFPYRSYSVLDTIPVLVDSAGGSYSLNSVLPACNERFVVPCDQTLRLDDVSFAGDAVSVGRLRYNLSTPVGQGSLKSEEKGSGGSGQYSNRLSGIESAVSIKPGQSIVLGKLSGAAGMDAIFLVVSRPAK